MAYKRKKATTRRAPARRRTTAKRAPVRRRRMTTKKKGLSEFLTGPQAKNTMNNMAMGTIGAGLYYLYNEKVDINDQTPEKRGLWALAGAYVIGATMGKTNISSGIVGAAAFDYMSKKEFLSEGMDSEMKRQQYVNESNFYASLPETLSENDFMELSENMDLSEADYLPEYYQSY